MRDKKVPRRRLGTCVITASRHTHLIRGCISDWPTNATFVWGGWKLGLVIVPSRLPALVTGTVFLPFCVRLIQLTPLI